MLHMKSISKVYRTEMVETHALRGLTLEVRDGEFVAITGPSGSGKTTFLNIAGLLEELTGGEYVLEELNAQGTIVVIVTHDPEIAARARRNVHIVDGIATDLERGSALARPLDAARSGA